MRTTAWPPRAATRLAVSIARSTAWPCASALAARPSAATGVTALGRDAPSSSGRTPGEDERDLELLVRGQRAGEAAQRLALAGARRRR